MPRNPKYEVPGADQYLHPRSIAVERWQCESPPKVVRYAGRKKQNVYGLSLWKRNRARGNTRVEVERKCAMRFVPRSLCCGMWLVLIPCVSAALTHVAHPHEYSSKALIDRSEPATMQSDTNSLGSSQSTETSLSGRRASGQFSAKVHETCQG